MTLSAGDRLGRYEVLEPLGAGGMGEVYRARDTELEREVAIKVLPEAVAQNPDRLERFRREAKAVAKLSHPNILAIHDFGTEEGVTYSVTELLEGETLRERLEGGTLGWRKATEIGAAIADGLAAAHGAGIIHRDLKPDNVFLTSDGRVKILDFGLAQVKEPLDVEADTATLTPVGTTPGTVMGTVGYMSPEQVSGKALDHRSDIFSLGCVLYEMVSGQRAFARDTAVETMNAILKEEPADISASGEALPPELAGTVRRCLEKKPQSRFQSASDLAYNLRSVSSHTGLVDGTLRHAVSGRQWRWAVFGGLCVVTAAVAIWRLAPRLETPVPAREIPRIVVLPFENLGAHEDEYFADGITEEITSRLAAVSGLRVISRTSAMQYKEDRPTLQQIGEELDVGYVLEGTIRWDRSEGGHGRVRITPQLIRVADDSHLWSERYDRVLEDIFAVQSDIAAQVISQLQATLLERERSAVEARHTDNMEAYQAYLLGLRYASSTTESDIRMTLDMLERAVRLDPAFAVAHAKLSETQSRLYHFRYDFTPERLEMARASVERAMELQPGLPEGHRALGYYYYFGFRDYDRAAEQFAIAEEMLPNDAGVLVGIYAVLRRQGRWAEALKAFGKWQRVDPQRYDAVWDNPYVFLREYEKADQETRRAIAIAPDLPDAYWRGALGYLLQDGTTGRARRLLESAPRQDAPDIKYLSLVLDLYDRNPQAVMARLEGGSIDGFDTQYWLVPRELLECTCLSQMGRQREADAACKSAVEVLEREIVARPYDHRAYLSLGHAFALLGRREEALAAGEHAAALMPIAKDALDGTHVAIELAKIYAQVGEADGAFELIEELLSIPSRLSVGLLRLDPAWDPLRDDPRFQALLEEDQVD